MEDASLRANRRGRHTTIYEPSFAEYMIALHHFQSKYGLLPNELPVYHPMQHPNLCHDMVFKPIAPTQPTEDASPHEHQQYTLARADYDTAIENIDIGGPAMIRAAAKNHAFVNVVVDVADYEPVLAELREHGGTRLAFRQTLVQTTTRHASRSAYD